MKVYVVVKTARKDVADFPGYFANPHRPVLCLVDSYSGESCTQDKAQAEETVREQIAEYGEYFNYVVQELEVE